MDLILHQYPESSFAEKIRLALGLKGLAWHAVEIPAFEPKPDYTPLTAGYRRTPALQIGADVYCDTRLIAEVLEQLAPAPSVYAPDPRTRALGETLITWGESQLMWPIARYITGLNARAFSAEFHLDRARLHGKPAPSVEQVVASAGRFLPQVAPQLAWLEDLLAPGQPFLLGAEPTLADFAVYAAPWRVRWG